MSRDLDTPHDQPLTLMGRLLVPVSNYSKTRVVGLTIALQLAFWVLLWRLPLLMGDDRLFAVASGLPSGQQTLSGIRKMVELTWFTMNGRLADGLGPVYFMLGENSARLFFAALYPLLTFLLWRWYRIFAPAHDTPRSALQIAGELFLFASIPFLAIGFDPHVAGHSIFLMAAVWNYLIPLVLILATLLPFARRITGTPYPLWSEITVIPFIIIAMIMHEMATVTALCLVTAALIFHPRNLTRYTVFFTLTPLLVGAAIKFTAPGLSARAERNHLELDTSGLVKFKERIARFGGTLSDYGSYQLALILLTLACVILFVFLAHTQGQQVNQRLAKGATFIIALALPGWVFLSRRMRLGVARLYEEHREYTLDEFFHTSSLIFIFGVLTIGALFFLHTQLPKESTGTLPHILLVAAFLMLGVEMFTATTQFGELNRAHYFTEILLGTAIVSLVLRMKVSGVPAWVTTSLVTVITMLTIMNLSSATHHLLINHSVWANVSTQIDSVRRGDSSHITVPTTLPCTDVASYYFPGDRERAANEFRTYYDLPSETVVHFDENPRHCGYGRD